MEDFQNRLDPRYALKGTRVIDCDQFSNFQFCWFQVLKDMERVKGRPGASLTDFNFNELKNKLVKENPQVSERDVMSAALYPKVTDDFLSFREKYGPVDKLNTRIFLTGPKVGEEFDVSITYNIQVLLKNCI